MPRYKRGVAVEHLRAKQKESKNKLFYELPVTPPEKSRLEASPLKFWT